VGGLKGNQTRVPYLNEKSFGGGGEEGEIENSIWLLDFRERLEWKSDIGLDDQNPREKKTSVELEEET